MRIRGYLIIAVAVHGFCPAAFGQVNGSDAELRSSLQRSETAVRQPVSVSASIVQAGVLLRSPEAARHIRMSLQVTQPDGSSFLKALFDNGLDGDAHAGDGVYSCSFTPAQPGSYLVKVIAEGKGIHRVQEHALMVREPGQAAKPAGHEPEPHMPAKGAEAKPAEPTEKGRAGASWLLVTLVNAAAALLWLAGLAVFFRFRGRRTEKTEAAAPDFGVFLRQQAGEKRRQIDAVDEKAAEAETADSKVIQDLKSARIQFLDDLAKEEKNRTEDAAQLWGRIYKSFDSSLKTVLKKQKTALDRIDQLQEKVEEIGGISDDLKTAQAVVEKQAKKIAFLMSFKDVMAEAQQRFEVLKGKNRDLEKKLFEAAQKAGIGDALSGPLAEFQENYRQLELCVATLEQENDRLVAELIRWQGELERMKAEGPAGADDRSSGMSQPNEELEKRVSELEQLLRTKEKELEEAQRRFDALESEYMVLYQEKLSAQQQPDI